MRYVKQLAGIFLGLYIILIFQLVFLQSMFSFQKTIHTAVPMVSASSKTTYSNNNKAILGAKTIDFANKISKLETAQRPLPTPSLQPTKTPTPTPTPTPVGDPISVAIPTLGIDTTIVQVGITKDNIMDTPFDFNTVGWFTGSVKPGAEGVSILTGHYDDLGGKPAIFYQLSILKEGDAIIIKTNTEQEIEYIVESSINEPYKTFPKELLYSTFEGKVLRLITCNGIWDIREKTYSKRLVVTAKQR